LTGEPAKPLKPDTEINGDIPLAEKHQPILMSLLAAELNVKGNNSCLGANFAGINYIYTKSWTDIPISVSFLQTDS
jgi:hypothetical protein